MELVWLSCSRPWCQSPPAASNYAQESLDRYFRIEYQVEPSVARPVVSGYVLQTGRVVLQGKSAELRGSDLVRKAYLGM